MLRLALAVRTPTLVMLAGTLFLVVSCRGAGRGSPAHDDGRGHAAAGGRRWPGGLTAADPPAGNEGGPAPGVMGGASGRSSGLSSGRSGAALASVAAPATGGPATGRLPALPSTPASAARVQHVIIISEDGLRPDALLLARGPVMAEVMKHAAYSLTATTIRHASTLPSHAAMLSGFDEDVHGLTWNSWRPGRGFILVPTVFDAAERAGRSSAAFVGKQKLEHAIPPGSVGLFSRPGFLCHAVSQAAAQYFVEQRPAVEFVHFADPDEIGHHQGWMSDEQIHAIRGADGCIANMIDAVHRAGADADTLFILSADHGGHGKNHTGRIKEDRLIPWIAWGAGIRPHRLDAPVSTMDTAATALWALGLPRPLAMEGHPVEEAFSN